jgi:hypothetical protein
LGFRGKLRGKLGCSGANPMGKLPPDWSIFCHCGAHTKPHQANTHPLGLLRWHGGLQLYGAHCVMFAPPPPKPYGELNRLNIMNLNHGFRIRISEMDESIRIRVNHVTCLDQLRVLNLVLNLVWLLYATKFSTVALTKCATWKCFEDNVSGSVDTNSKTQIKVRK